METKAENTNFPQYRRYSNGLSYFKILSLTEFEEIKMVGNKAVKSRVEAKQYPEKVFINDLLFKEGFAEVIREDVYRAVERMI